MPGVPQANPAGWYSKMHNATLTDQAELTLGTATATRVFTPQLPDGTNGAASDLTLSLQLPPDAQAVAFELRVLARPAQQPFLSRLSLCGAHS